MSQIQILRLIASFDDRIDYLMTIDIRRESYPWELVTQAFDDVVDQEDPDQAAFEVAMAFKQLGGPIIIEAGISHYYRRYETIMDVFKVMRAHRPGIKILKRAFRRAGFRDAGQCDEHTLRRLYLETGLKEF
jgi:hypothetical protein